MTSVVPDSRMASRASAALSVSPTMCMSGCPSRALLSAPRKTVTGSTRKTLIMGKGCSRHHLRQAGSPLRTTTLRGRPRAAYGDLGGLPYVDLPMTSGWREASSLRFARRLQDHGSWPVHRADPRPRYGIWGETYPPFSSGAHSPIGGFCDRNTRLMPLWTAAGLPPRGDRGRAATGFFPPDRIEPDDLTRTAWARCLHLRSRHILLAVLRSHLRHCLGHALG